MAPIELTCVRDTCNVWVLRRGRDAVCVDFGSGAVLDRFDELGIDRVTDVLVTHFHRDGVQGLARATAAGVRVWVPPVEAELFTDAAGHWACLQAANSYDLRQETLAPFVDVEIAGTVDEYRTRAYGGIDVYTQPTPGHTMGSVTYLVDLDGRRAAFSGDLLHAGGRLWSLAATQWSYSGVDGQAATLLSLRILAGHRPDTVYPAHGPAIDDPDAGIAETERRLAELMELRRSEEMPFAYARWVEAPWRLLLPHLLLNTTSMATSYALLSGDGAALLVDWGYDQWTGWPYGGRRHQTRPLLESIGPLLRDHGVDRVEAVVTTHYHDDHVAGANLLRDVYGAEVWSPENVAPILESPERYDIPCLWFDPVPVDRVLRFGEPVRWHEHELQVHPLPGHTRYAAAIAFETDGRRVLATGDQQSFSASGRMVANYQYRNRFAIDDYVASASLYERLRPDLILTGHSGAHEPAEPQLERFAADARRISELHRELLPLPDAEGVFARVAPYRARVAPGGTLELEVELRSPLGAATQASVSLAAPDGWAVEPARATAELEPHGEATVVFRVTAGREHGRVPVAADVTIGELVLGLHAEALVTVG
ncbi:MAG TPA: MBL fold metallo-hydrolase [Gaiellaceae bacterium]|jgi:glyoxylase-like metal-dependent hydrolase (beta-lactamase superfamily II)|nr:MBL fold metallo-hydrolase [Gaiellaceae bacterium]